MKHFRLAFLLALLAGTALMAQPENPNFSLSTSTFFEIDLRNIALIDIETSQASANFTLNVGVPTEAGSPLGSNPLATNTDNWINYSNAVTLSASRNIEISINSGTLPADFQLQVTVGGAVGAGAGVTGSPVAGPINISSSPQEIITNIRGAYTGDGPNNGHQLSFALNYIGTDFSLLESEDVPVQLIYTIIDN